MTHPVANGLHSVLRLLSTGLSVSAVVLSILVAPAAILGGPAQPAEAQTNTGAQAVLTYATTHVFWSKWDNSSPQVAEGNGQPNFQCSEFVARSIIAAANGTAGALTTNSGPNFFVNAQFNGNSYAGANGAGLLYAGNLYKYLVDAHVGTDIGTSNSDSRISVGDAVFYREGTTDFVHVALVSDVSNRSDIRVIQHNSAWRSLWIDGHKDGDIFQNISHILHIDYSAIVSGALSPTTAATNTAVTISSPGPYDGRLVTSAPVLLAWTPRVSNLQYEVSVFDVHGALAAGVDTTVSNFSFQPPHFGQYTYVVQPIGGSASWLSTADSFSYGPPACLDSPDSFGCAPGSSSGATDPPATGCLGAPSVLAPLNDTTVGTRSVTFSWAPPAGCTPIAYNFEVSLDGNPANAIVSTSSNGPSFSYTFASDSTFFWHVRAVSSAGVGGWSTASITVSTTNPGCQTPAGWSLGAIVGLRQGAEIWQGPGDVGNRFVLPNTAEQPWNVEVIDGPRCPDGQVWMDISRAALEPNTGNGTGWVVPAQAQFSPPTPPPPPPVCNPGPEGVILYDQPDWQGNCWTITQDTANLGSANDAVSSVRVIGPFQATLFLDPVGLPPFDGQVDYAAFRRGAWWICCSYSTGVR